MTQECVHRNSRKRNISPYNCYTESSLQLEISFIVAKNMAKSTSTQNMQKKLNKRFYVMDSE